MLHQAMLMVQMALLIHKHLKTKPHLAEALTKLCMKTALEAREAAKSAAELGYEKDYLQT